MNHTPFITATSLALLVATIAPSPASAANLSGEAPSASSARTPNILFLLVDDLGWSDLACYGHPWHQTPHIDRLASQGMRFTQAYAPAPICSASRAGILTGKSVARVGMEFVVKNEPGYQDIIPPQSLQAPPYTNGLPLPELTIAELLSTAGYETAYFGKWHLNSHHHGQYLAWSPTHGPSQQGFNTAIEDFGSHPCDKPPLKNLKTPGAYHPDSMTQKAITFIIRNHQHPFFLMVSHFYVHTPVETPYPWLLEKYQTLIPANVPSRDNRVTYAAFLETLDHYVGQLLTALENTGLADETLVVFLSDNGGHPEYVANEPLRGSKWNLYEGGIRVPMIARWPDNIPPGSTCATPVIGYDLFPTFAHAAKGSVPENESPIDGHTLLPLFNDPTLTLDRALYWHFPYYHPEGKKFAPAKKHIGIDDFAFSQTRPHSAVRHGPYKLIYFEEDQRTELYHLENDLSEQNDLNQSNPGKAIQLKNELLQYLEQVHARRATKSL